MLELDKWQGILELYSNKWGTAVFITDSDGQFHYPADETLGNGFPADEWGTIQHLAADRENGFYYETGKGECWFISSFPGGRKFQYFVMIGPVSSSSISDAQAMTHQEFTQLTTLVAGIIAEQQQKEVRDCLLELISQLKKGEEAYQLIPSKILPLGFIDMIGIAFQQTKDSVFHVEQVWGEGHSSLQHSSFQYGQGLLGLSAAMGKTMVWKDIKKDPRSAYFNNLGISFETLLCFPIQNEKVNGLLYWGFKYPFSPDDVDILLGELLADEIGKQLAMAYWIAEAKVQKNQIHTLSEICQVMTETDNVQQILYMIMDISLYLVSGKFCGIVWFDPANQEQATILGRGISQDRLTMVGNSLLHQWRTKESPFVAQPSTYAGEGFEIPLFFRDTCYGVMLLDFSQVKEEDGYLSFFQTIAIMSGMALNHIAINTSLALEPPAPIPETARDLSVYVQKMTVLTEREQEVLSLIAQGKNNKEIALGLFISENTVKNHITNILRKLGVADRSQAMAAVYQVMADSLKT